MRKLLSWVSAAGLALGPALLVPATAVAAPECSTDWGTEAEYQAPSMLPHETAHPLSVRAGQDECWDRLVVELEGEFQGYVVGYVDELSGIGSGLPIPSRGDAALAISFEAQAYGELDGTDFRIFYGPHDPDEVWDVSGFPAFRQVLWQGSFEGRTAMGLGVREELPFRVLVLDGPDGYTRLVVDVAHTP